MAKVYDNATDLITFARSSSGTALRRVGYGDELVDNSGFNSDISGWSLIGDPASSISYSSGKMLIDAVTLYDGATQTISVTPGKVYRLSADIDLITSARARIRAETSGVLAITTSDGELSLVFMASSNSELIRVDSGANTGTLTVDNISVREVIFDRPSDDLVLFNHPDDIPRIEYAADGSLKGLLIEEQRTNLVTHSEDFTHLYESNVVFTHGVSSPTGGSNATIFSPTTSDANAISAINLNLNTGSYTGSVWAKGVGSSVGKTFRMWFYHLSSTGDSGIQTFTLTDEWQRFDVLGTVTSTGDTRFRIDVGSAHTEDFHVFGLQLEAGSFATSYIPTSGSQQTRSADLASIPVTAFGYNQDAGSLLVDVNTFDNDYGNWVWELDGSSDTSLYAHGAGTGWRLFGAGGTIAYLGTLPANASANIGYAYDHIGSSALIDGGSITAQTFGQPVNVATLKIGATGPISRLNGHIKSLKYYPRRLTDAQLQELTS